MLKILVAVAGLGLWLSFTFAMMAIFVGSLPGIFWYGISTLGFAGVLALGLHLSGR